MPCCDDVGRFHGIRVASVVSVYRPACREHRRQSTSWFGHRMAVTVRAVSSKRSPHVRSSPPLVPRARPCRAARRDARLQRREDPAGGRGAAAGGRCRAGGHPRHGLLHHPRAQSQRRGGRAVGRPADERGAARGPAPHDDAPRLRCPHADGAAPGQDLVLHAAHGRGGGELRLPQGARAGRHELPDLSPGRAADRRRLSDARHDVPDLLQRARSAEGPAAPGDVLLTRARLLLDLRQSRDPVRPGGRLGDGLGDEARHEDRRRLDRRRLDGRVRLPRRAGLRLDLQGAGRAQHRQQPVGRSRPSRASPAAARAPSPRAAWASAFRRCGSTATIISPSTPSRAGRSSGRGAISVPRWSST